MSFEGIAVMPPPENPVVHSVVKEASPRVEIPIDRVEGFAREAGTIIKNHYQEGVKPEYKSARQVATVADRESEALLKKNLLELHNCSFYGEEEGGKGLAEGDQWVVDPLDGTENMDGYPPTIGVSIGLLRNGEPVLGAVYDPIHDVMYSAKKGEGIRVNGQEVKASSETDPAKARVGIDFSSNMATRAETLEYLKKILLTQGARTTKVFGAPVLSLAAVAAGKLELFARPATKLPDLVAGVCLVREAGERVVDFDGKEWTIDAKGIIAGSPAMVDAYLPAFLPEPISALTTNEKPSEEPLQRPTKRKTREVMQDPNAFSWERAVQQLKEAKRKGQTIVISNGHFALFHAGHSLSLEEAREVGVEARTDHNENGVVLLAIVNNDAQTYMKDPVKAAAGSAHDRALNVYGNTHTDVVVVSEAPVGDTTLTTDFRRLAEEGLIDANTIYVKGGDYGTTSNVPPEARIVQEYGGRFTIVDRQEGFSTTDQIVNIIDALKAKGVA